MSTISILDVAQEAIINLTLKLDVIDVYNFYKASFHVLR